MAESVTEAAVIEALRKVRDPDLSRDIVSLGFVKDIKISGGHVGFTIELTTPACPVRDQMKEEARRVVSNIAGVHKADIKMTSQVRSAAGMTKSPHLSHIKNLIPIASGKGGVGKSTVSVNLALALSSTGASVGLLDADVYGPSIPRIMGISELPSMEGDRILPVRKHQVKVISTDFFMREKEAAIVRGPILHRLMEQFLSDVEWGELDYLVIDLPPGTGDVQLSLCQIASLTGAVIVSTPQEVALRVAEKAILMFGKLNCPVLGIIENMSYYLCGHCGRREEIFGSGGAREASERWGIPFLGEIPLGTALRSASDAGNPIVISEPESPWASSFVSIAQNLAAQISIRNMGGKQPEEMRINF